jgi:hypothetical protein
MYVCVKAGCAHEDINHFLNGEHSDPSFMAFPKLRAIVTDPNNFLHKHFAD